MSKSGDDAGSLNHLVVAQLSKTKMCAMFARGSCHDAACRFSHSLTELRAPPDLTKTAMCRAFARGECNDTHCKFAHGESELRVTESVYKTQLCNFFMRGHCKKGNRCRHAHGNKELRSFRPEGSAAKIQKPTELKPLSPGRVHNSQGGDGRFQERPLWEMLSVESSLPSSPTVQTPPTSQWPVDCLRFDDGLETRSGSPVGAALEVPMKVPLPMRPHAGFEGFEGFDTPSRSLVPTPPLAGFSPLAAAPELPWRSDPMLPQLGLDCDPAGLAAAMAAAAMEHTAAAKLASVHAWTLANAAMKANYSDLSRLHQAPPPKKGKQWLL